MDQADSIVFNPHKWLMTNFDCTAYFVRDVEALLRACRISPEYLRTTHDAEVVNFRDWGIQLGRRFRALKLWFVLRSYGVAGLQAIIRRHVALAAELAGWIEADPEFERGGAGAVRAGLFPLVSAGQVGGGARRAERAAARPGQRQPSGASHAHEAGRADTSSGWSSASARRGERTWKGRGG